MSSIKITKIQLKNGESYQVTQLSTKVSPALKQVLDRQFGESSVFSHVLIPLASGH